MSVVGKWKDPTFNPQTVTANVKYSGKARNDIIVVSGTRYDGIGITYGDPLPVALTTTVNLMVSGTTGVDKIQTTELGGVPVNPPIDWNKTTSNNQVTYSYPIPPILVRAGVQSTVGFTVYWQDGSTPTDPKIVINPTN